MWLCRASSDNPAKSSEFPNPTNRYWLFMTLLYHAKFRALRLPDARRSMARTASKSIELSKLTPRQSLGEQAPKSNAHPPMAQSEAEISSRRMIAPTAESARAERTRDARSSALIVHAAHPVCANHLRARTGNLDEAPQSSKAFISGQPGKHTFCDVARALFAKPCKLHLAKSLDAALFGQSQ
jgi:hypothetical protein